VLGLAPCETAETVPTILIVNSFVPQQYKVSLTIHAGVKWLYLKCIKCIKCVNVLFYPFVASRVYADPLSVAFERREVIGGNKSWIRLTKQTIPHPII
jgi:hypothetical protein